MMNKPFSQACENNKKPILNVLTGVFANSQRLLEIGSGTGQHAVYFAAHMPHLLWQPTDLADNLPGIQLWIDEAQRPNLLPLIELDVTAPTKTNQAWANDPFDAVFSANTAHIMPWASVVSMIEGVGLHLSAKGRFALYGPFKYKGKHTSSSNAEFDAFLKSRTPHQGIRDIEEINALAKANHLQLLEDNAMPANNRLLVWEK